jgi:hypothetical protein
VRILLDENMPESLRSALSGLGHEVDSQVFASKASIMVGCIKTSLNATTSASARIVSSFTRYVLSTDQARSTYCT